MISYAWRTGFGAAEESELREMLAEAAAADAEAGFPRVRLDQPYGTDASHLIVRLLPDERAGRDAPAASPLAAYLRVEPDPDGGPATARYVVRPAFRSRGISTLLLERLGLDLRAPGGWAGTGASSVRIWARGDHPAAERMAGRFQRAGVQTARRQWQLLAPLRAAGPPDRTASAAPDVLPGPDISPGPGVLPGPDVSPVPGRWPVRPVAGAAEQAAAAELWHRCAGRANLPGRAEILVAGRGPIAVDTRDHALARSCRLLGFRHDRTDTEYILSQVPRR